MILMILSTVENISDYKWILLQKSIGIDLSSQNYSKYLLQLDISNFENTQKVHFYLRIYGDYNPDDYKYTIKKENITEIVLEDYNKIETEPKDFNNYKIIYFDIEKTEGKYLIILIRNITKGYITNTQYDESKINELSINLTQTINFNENHAFIKVNGLTNLDKISTKFETNNNLKKEDIKVYIYKKDNFTTFDELKEDLKIKFEPYQIINGSNYYYYSLNQLNDDEILLFHIMDNIDKMDCTVKEGEVFYKEKNITNMKSEFKFENDINYYFYTLSSSTPINYLFKYNCFLFNDTNDFINSRKYK